MNVTLCRAAGWLPDSSGHVGAAARRLAALLLLCAAGCSTQPTVSTSVAAPAGADPETYPDTYRSTDPGRYPEPVFSARRVLSDDVVDPLAVYDPWHGTNRRIYSLNASIDQVVLNPTVAFYRRLLPSPVRRGVTNFFDNLDMVRTTANLALQGRPRATGAAALRLLTNSTLGIGGFFDPATSLGIGTYYEDFGQTLGRYGTRPGPYLMLPLFGPTNLRDALGLGVDFLWFGFLDPLELSDNPGWGGLYYPLLVIDTRAETAFQYFETGSPFEYELVRKLFMTKRKLDVAK